MSDTYFGGQQSSSSDNQLGGFDSVAQLQAYHTARRAKIALDINPEFHRTPEALYALAQSGEALGGTYADQAATIFGMQRTNQMLDTMNRLSPGAQRAAWSRLSQAQQGSLVQLGYAPASSDDGPGKGLASNVFGQAAGVVGAPLDLIGNVAKPVLGETLNALIWMEQRVSNFYRAVRTMDSDAQWMALAGAAAGIAAAPLTAGASLATIPGTLATLGLVGGSALIGGTAGAMVATSPGQWWEAYQNSWDGERTFLVESQHQARALLRGDTMLTSIAKEVAWNSDIGDVYELARHVAGTRDPNAQNTALRSLEAAAETMADPGTPEFERAYELLLQLASTEEFAEAVRVLDNGKISPGRDAARLAGLSPGTTPHRLVSGGVDALWIVAMDPLLGAAKVRHSVRAVRYGVQLDNVTEGLNALISKNASVRRAWGTLATAVDRGDTRLVREQLPEAQLMYREMLQFKRINQIDDFTVKHALDYINEAEGYKQLLSGQMAQKGESRLLVSALTPNRMAWNAVKREARAAIDTIEDARLAKWAADANIALPYELFSQGDVAYNYVDDLAAAAEPSFGSLAGQALSVIPGVKTLNAAVAGLVAKLPPGTSVDLNNVQEIEQMVEMGRITGIPSNVRRFWTDAIVQQDDFALRLNATSAYLDEMLRVGGLHATEEGSQLANQFVSHWRQMYGFGDDVIIGGRARRAGELPGKHEALELVIPDLKQLRQLTKRGYVLKNVLAVTDSTMVEQRFMKVWKPAVLMRVGFVARAAGEELVSLLARTTVRDFAQTRRALWHQHRDIANAVQKREAIGVFDDPARQIIRPRTKYETEAIKRQWAPGTRWAGDYLSRSHGGSPLDLLVTRYSDFLDNATRNGLSGWKIDDSIARMRDTPNTLAGRYEAGARAMMLNLSVGRERSMRRMWLNGVDPNISKALRGWVGHIGDDIMKELSAQEASVWASERLVDKVLETEVMKSDGTRETLSQVVIRGERGAVQKGDSQFEAGVHGLLREVAQDPVTMGAVASVLPGYMDPALNIDNHFVSQLNKAIDDLDSLDLPQEVHVVIDQLIGSSNDRTWRAVVEHIDRTDSDLARVVYEFTERNNRVDDISPTALLEILDEAGAGRFLNPLGGGLLRGEDLKILSRSLSRFDEVFAHGGPGELAWARQFTAARRNGRQVETFTGMDELRTRLVEATRLQVIENPKYFNSSIRSHTHGAGRPLLEPVPDNSIRIFAPDNAPAVLNDVRTQFAGADPAVAARSMLDSFKTRSNQYTIDGWSPDDVADDIYVSLFDQTLRLPDDGLGGLATMPSGSGGSVAAASVGSTDPRIARAVSMFYDDLAGVTISRGALRQFDVSDDILHLRAGVATDGATPINFENHVGQRTFAIDMEILGDRGERVRSGLTLHDNAAGVLWEEAVDGYVTSIVDDTILKRFRDMSAAGASRRADDFNIARLDSAGQPVPIPAGERLQAGTQPVLIGPDGKPTAVKWGAPEYFELANSGSSDRVLWEAVGPLLEDHLDLARNRQLFSVMRSADNPLDPTVGNLVPALRSSPADISKLAEELLPSAVYDEILALKPANLWEKIVTKGFGWISSSIDAIVRRPMAMHYYVNAYTDTARHSKWLLHPETMSRADDLAAPMLTKMTQRIDDVKSMEFGAVMARARKDRIPQSADEARTYLATQFRFTDRYEISKARDTIRAQAAREGVTLTTSDLDDFEFIATWGVLKDSPGIETLINRATDISGGLLPKTLSDDQTAAMRSVLGTTELSADARRKFDQTMRRVLPDSSLWDLLDAEGHGAVKAAVVNMTHADDTIRTLASTRAIENAVPFLDSHEFRSQFAEWGKGLMPFWYAEENFLKRMARTFAIAPESVRKMQLAYMGVKSAGLIRTDANGQDWFVYPGSQALTDALAPLMNLVPGVSGTESLGLLFQARTDQLLPGYSSDVGRPAAAPFISMSMNTVSDMFTELQPLHRAIVGDISASKSGLDQLMPTTVTRVFDAIAADERNEKYASAMMSSLAFQAANGQIPDNPTTMQLQTVMDRARNHARMTLVAQAAVGFLVPGAPRGVRTGGEEGLSLAAFLGVDVEDVGELFNDEYRQLIGNLGIDDGTQEYLNRHADHDMFDFINPLAFTVARTSSESGAPLPASVTVMDHYDDRKEWYDEHRLGGPWLFPQETDPSFNSFAYNEQIVNGLRKRRTPDEFMTEFLRKNGALVYFEMKNEYEELRDSIVPGREGDNQRKVLDAEWSLASERYKLAHPVFAAELESVDARQRREQVITEINLASEDPHRPQNPHADAVVELVDNFQRYNTARVLMAEDQSGAGRDALANLKRRWAAFGEAYALNNPSVASFWLTVIQPSSEL